MELDLNASTYEEETLSDHYVLLNTLGKGAFAEVKLACHLLTNIKVAVKILANGEENDGNNRKELNFMKELDHPYIIKLFHIIDSKDHTYMVLEFAAQGSLVTHIEEVVLFSRKRPNTFSARLCVQCTTATIMTLPTETSS